MSIKKGYCTHCQSAKETNRIFSVNDEASFCYCPNCMHKYSPNEAIDNFNFYIANLCFKAENILYQATDYKNALECFGHIIDLDSNNVRARFGRLMCYTFLSTLRNNYFDQIAIMLKEEALNFYRNIDTLVYTKFLKKINKAINDYDNTFVERLRFKKYFYDVDCVELFFKNLLKIKKLKEVILDEIEFLKTKDDFIDVSDKIATLKAEIYKINQEMSKTYGTVDGYFFSFERQTAYGEIVLNKLPRKKIDFSYPKKYKLNSDSKNRNYIKDIIYPNNVVYYLVKKRTLQLSILLAFISIGCLIASFLVKQKQVSFGLAVGSISFGALFLILLIIYIVVRSKVYKRRHLID